MKRQGILFIISAPSGAGKTTLCKEVIDILPNLLHSVSYTTRAPRPGEVCGRDYFFVSPAEFASMVAAGEFADGGELLREPQRLREDVPDAELAWHRAADGR